MRFYISPLFVLICSFFSSCDTSSVLFSTTEKDKKPPFYDGPADITVINTSTLDTARYSSGIDITYSYGGTTVSSHVSINGNEEVYQRDTLYFHRNDQMKVIFTPPRMFSDNSYNVRYLVFDLEDTITEIPYEFNCIVYSDIPTGLYNIDCYAMSPSWDREKSKCYQTCTFWVVE